MAVPLLAAGALCAVSAVLNLSQRQTLLGVANGLAALCCLVAAGVAP